ncbi:hypothetical protein Sjap_008911 [Stephania japonica]|uniref:Uncharacterized protein n=1 Tax=Stephania japonica TaxID=461633 RepID=A0AAP0JSV7_9MAGN
MAKVDATLSSRVVTRTLLPVPAYLFSGRISSFHLSLLSRSLCQTSSNTSMSLFPFNSFSRRFCNSCLLEDSDIWLLGLTRFKIFNQTVLIAKSSETQIHILMEPNCFSTLESLYTNLARAVFPRPPRPTMAMIERVVLVLVLIALLLPGSLLPDSTLSMSSLSTIFCFSASLPTTFDSSTIEEVSRVPVTLQVFAMEVSAVVGVSWKLFFPSSISFSLLRMSRIE